MGKKSPPPKAPDLTPITDAQMRIAEQSNELAREFLGLSREQFAFFQENAKEELALAREQAARLFEYQDKAFESGEQARQFAEEVGRKQMEAMDLQMDYARRDRERYESTFLPMQDQYIKEAQEYDTLQRREQEAARASVDIQRQAEAARQNADQRLRSMGIDPSQMRSASLLDTQNVALAAQQAGAANAARQQVEDRGRAMRADALNVGAGLPAQALAGYQSASGAGSAAVGAGAAGQSAQLGAIQGGAGVGSTAMGFRSQALGNLAQLTGSPTQWAGMGGNMLGQASNAYGNAANTINSGFQNQMASWKAGQEQSQQNFNNIASVASLAAGFMMAEGGSPVQREDYDFDFSIDQPAGAIKVSVPRAKAPSKRSVARAINDPYLRGDLSMEDRWANAKTALSQFRAGQQYFAEGGDRPRASMAIPVRQQRDKIPAFIGEGEYVIPADVHMAKGTEFFDKLVAKYHRSNA